MNSRRDKLVATEYNGEYDRQLAQMADEGCPHHVDDVYASTKRELSRHGGASKLIDLLRLLKPDTKTKEHRIGRAALFAVVVSAILYAVGCRY